LKQEPFGGEVASLTAPTATTFQSASVFKWYPQFVLLFAVVLPALSSFHVSTTMVPAELLTKTRGKAHQGIGQTGKQFLC